MLYYHIQLYYTISYYILYYKSSFQIISKANHLGPSRGHAWSNATQLDVPDFYRFLLCPKRLGDKTICTLLFCPWGYRFTWSSLPKEKIREGVQFNCTTYEGILDNIGIEVQNVHHQLHARQKENRIRTQKTAATSAPRRSLFPGGSGYSLLSATDLGLFKLNLNSSPLAVTGWTVAPLQKHWKFVKVRKGFWIWS